VANVSNNAQKTVILNGWAHTITVNVKNKLTNQQSRQTHDLNLIKTSKRGSFETSMRVSSRGKQVQSMPFDV
jgi:hypothetical protein